MSRPGPSYDSGFCGGLAGVLLVLAFYGAVALVWALWRAHVLPHAVFIAAAGWLTIEIIRRTRKDHP